MGEFPGPKLPGKEEVDAVGFQKDWEGECGGWGCDGGGEEEVVKEEVEMEGGIGSAANC